MIVKNKKHRLFTFFTLVLTLYDFMEENDIPDAVDYKFQVKHYTKELKKMLPAMIDKMIKRTGFDEGLSSVDQYVTASQIMEHLFNVGLQIEDIENEIRKQSLVNQLNILLHSYNLPQLELMGIDERVNQLIENKEDDKT
jgi:hypothetical protein